jgi:uncharacterized membrane protein
MIIRVLTAALGVWLILIIVAPIMVATDSKSIQYFGTAIYFLMDPVCHQIPARSLFLNELPLPVCARCFSIYAGGFIVFLIALIKKPTNPWPKLVYMGIGSLIIIEILAEKIQLYHNLTELRMISGLLLGMLIFRIILETLIKSKVQTRNG